MPWLKFQHPFDVDAVPATLPGADVDVEAELARVSALAGVYRADAERLRALVDAAVGKVDGYSLAGDGTGVSVHFSSASELTDLLIASLDLRPRQAPAAAPRLRELLKVVSAPWRDDEPAGTGIPR